MNWSPTKGRFVALLSLLPLAWYVSVLLNTNGGWGWSDPQFAARWIGRSLAGWSALAGAIALLLAAFWRPRWWTIFAPALVVALGFLTRRLYVIGSPPEYFLEDRAGARWFLAAICLLQLLALSLMLVPQVKSPESGVTVDR